MKWETNPNVQAKEIIVDKPQNESWQPHYSLFHINTKFGFSVVTDEGHEGAYSSPPLLENEWYHVVGTYNGSLITFYVNGVAERTKDLTGSIRTSLVPVTIDSEEDLDSYFNGDIDEVAIYDMALTHMRFLCDINDFNHNVMRSTELEYIVCLN